MDMDSATFNLPANLGDGEPLGALDWPGLVARLGAERDLRRELAARIGAAASFSAGAAAVLEGTSTASTNGEPAVNPAALADCKAPAGIRVADGAEASFAGIEARGKE